MSLRDRQSQKNGGSGDVAKKATDVKSMLKMQHLQNLSVWAGNEASMSSYAAFLGNRFGTFREANEIPLDPSLVPCQKCESILRPGFNCTVRVETNDGKARRRRNRVYVPPKNIVVYTCHFCSHRNVKKGTPKRHMKEILASKQKPTLESESSSKGAINESKKVIVSETVLDQKSDEGGPRPFITPEVGVESSPVTPKLLLLEGKKKRRRKSLLKDEVGDENKSVTPDVEKTVGESSRKKRKGWSSLKEIAENSASNNRNITNLSLPFFI
ncbi:hypothetical protein ACHQM5_006745 [Ranunculus cassubicifolius]